MSTIERAMIRKGKGHKRKGQNERQAEQAPAGAPPHQKQGLRKADTPEAPGPTRIKGLQPRGPLLKVDISVLRRNGVYPPQAMEDGINNEYRRIKRPLLRNVTGRGVTQVECSNRIMITSAVPGEGKTFTSLNLALSIARDPDYSITLVDGDMPRARLSLLLGANEQPGLLDLLSDETLNPLDVIMPTNVDSLSFLPAGSRHALSEELLSSGRMDSIFAELADDSPRHVFLFDSPPILAAPDAVTLAHQVGQIVVVVKAGSTLRHQVIAAVEQLDPDKAINLILNQSLRGPGGDEYGGYYGYGQGR